MDLDGKKVAVLATDGFEEEELIEPRAALEDAGARTLVVSPKRGSIRGWKHTDWGRDVTVDLPLTEASPEDFHALLIPGGVMNPDKLRMEPGVIEFIRHFFDAGKPVAAICHGPQVLIEADLVRGTTAHLIPLNREGSEERGSQLGRS